VRLQRAAFDPTKIIDTARGGHRASGARDGLDMIRQLRRPRPRIAPGADRESIACERRARPAGDRVRVEFMANSERDAPSRWGSSRAIRTVLAVRQYQSRPVPDAVVEHIVEAGRLTGSGMNGQPWHFIVVRDAETLRRLGAMAPSGPYVAQAPLAIVVASEKSRVAVSDASLAIQSMLLAAWADGVGANWVGFGGVGGVKTLLGIPAGLDVFAILPFGYPARPWDGARSGARRCPRWRTSSDMGGRSREGRRRPPVTCSPSVTRCFSTGSRSTTSSFATPA
jgi:nitroreductase